MTSPITSKITRAMTYGLTAPLGTIMGQGGVTTPAFVSAIAPNISLALDFANNQAWAGGATVTPASLLTCARASPQDDYAVNAAGLLLPFAANVPRITSKGLLSELSRTNVCLWSRDLTNAAWVAVNTTVLKDQTGADGAANSGCSLTATLALGTVLQVITDASKARRVSAFVKRLVGTGTIQMTLDAGTTWTNITVTASYTQLTIPSQTLANPTVGFRIGTSGDSIAVDFIHCENGASVTSPIFTTTASVTRAADVITITDTTAKARALASKSVLFNLVFVNFVTQSIFLSFSNNSQLIDSVANTSLRIQPTSQSPAATAVIPSSQTLSSPLEVATSYDGTVQNIQINRSLSGMVASSAMTGSTGSTKVEIGCGNSVAQMNGYMSRMVFSAAPSNFNNLDLKANLIFPGDSLTDGQNASAQASNYPNVCVAALSGNRANYGVLNLGIRGQSADQFDTTNYDIQVAPMSITRYPKNIAVLWLGTNDIKNFAKDENQTYASIKNGWAKLRAKGFKIVAITCLPRNDAGFDVTRLAYNVLIKSDASLYDALADVAADANIGDLADTTNPTYYEAAGVHLTNAGYAIVAGIVGTAVAGLL